MKAHRSLLAGLVILLGAGWPTAALATVHVVTTLQDYAAIARDIGGDRVEAQAIVAGNADPHHIKPKPSYALMLRKADLFVSTGLDLELWAPVLVNKAGNPKIVDGALGYVAAAQGIHLLQKPKSLDRSGGDIHIYGNPHIQTSPLNAMVIARNIATGLCKVDPQGCPVYKKNLAAFDRKIEERLYGKQLIGLLAANTLNGLAANGRLIPFLEQHHLMDKLGGWLREGLVFRGQKIICYHKNWAYFSALFGLNVVDYVEAKPGIPPTARHVARLIDVIKKDHVPVLLAANYFERRKPQLIADRTGIIPVIVPTSVRGEPGVDTYFDLIDTWVGRLRDAYIKAGVKPAISATGLTTTIKP
ncbi:MAG: zinc ABC transporter substrate-binding protein [Acidobacteria bacterium]|nr:zinc ABC transporter substrate-binding protein [Acidobacteriota bacterium]